MKGNWKTIILYLLIISLAIGLCLALWSSKQDAKEITYGEAVELFKDNKVVEFKITSRSGSLPPRFPAVRRSA